MGEGALTGYIKAKVKLLFKIPSAVIFPSFLYLGKLYNFSLSHRYDLTFPASSFADTTDCGEGLMRKFTSKPSEGLSVPWPP